MSYDDREDMERAIERLGPDMRRALIVGVPRGGGMASRMAVAALAAEGLAVILTQAGGQIAEALDLDYMRKRRADLEELAEHYRPKGEGSIVILDDPFEERAIGIVTSFDPPRLEMGTKPSRFPPRRFYGGFEVEIEPRSMEAARAMALGPLREDPDAVARFAEEWGTKPMSKRAQRRARGKGKR